MSTMVKIAGHMASIEIEVIDYENRLATNESDADWLRCEVALNLGAVRGNLRTSFLVEDFECLTCELQRVLNSCNGEATFDTIENTLVFSITLDRRGKGKVTGEANYLGPPSSTLKFTFETDQSYLQETEKALSQVMANFPRKFRATGPANG